MKNAAVQEKLRSDVLQILCSGIRGADAGSLVRGMMNLNGHQLTIGGLDLRISSDVRVYVVAVGKASVAMSHAAQAIIGHRISEGVVITPYSGVPYPSRMTVITSSHPLPDTRSIAAARTVRRLLSHVRPGDLVLFLVSGGASSLMFDPPPSVPLSDVQSFFHQVLLRGVPIRAVNLLRKTLSSVHAGRLSRMAHPATQVTLLLSDVTNDIPEVIGSGPTVPDTTTTEQLLAVLRQYALEDIVPETIMTFYSGLQDSDFVRSDEPSFKMSHCFLIGNNRTALTACRTEAVQLGYSCIIEKDELIGESRDRGFDLAHRANRHRSDGPICRLTGGETTVTVTGNGVGGRNQELALAALCKRPATANWLVASVGTDGSDGPSGAAGAFADGLTHFRSTESGLDPRAFLMNNDSHTFFTKTQSLIQTGPTQTNVMDIAITLIPGNEP